MVNAVLAFASYLGSAIVLLIAFIWIYVKFTPYHEFNLIAAGNVAAATTLSGAVLGFTLPLVSSIFYTQSLPEMIIWAAITCVVQLLVFLAVRKHYAQAIARGEIAPALFVAALSVAVGLLNAVSISH